MISHRVWLSIGIHYDPEIDLRWYVFHDDFQSPKYSGKLAIF